MQTTFLKIFIFILCLSTIVSCDQPLFVKQKAKEKLVLNSILQVDSFIQVELSKTRDIFDPLDKVDWIRNAEVYLKCGSNTYEELLEYKGEGIYQSNHTAKYGEHYSIEIVHSTYENVSAEAIMPDRTEAMVRYIGEDNSEQQFELEIPQKQEGSFYIWEMIIEDFDGESNVRIYSTDKKTDNILPDESQDRNLIFLNSRTNSNTPSISSSFQAENITEDDLGRTRVRLLTVNQDMYKYFKSLELYRNSFSTQIDPVEIHSNVNNGLGIFGAYASTYVSVTQ